MRRLISFLLITLLLASCGTSNSFSKRKHLKGHFWNKSGGHSGAEERAPSEKENTFVQEEFETEESSSVEDKSTSLENENLIDESEKIPEQSQVDIPKNESNESISIDLEPKETASETLDETTSQTQERLSDKVTWDDIYFVSFMLSGILGLIFLILYFVLAAFNLGGVWMLVLSLGLILYFIINVIVFSIGYLG